jgi:hypothetical protein
LNVQPHDEAVPPNAFSNVHPDQVMPSPRCYFGADYLLWWPRKREVPALITLGNVQDPVPGAFGSPGTRKVVGPGGVDLSSQSGVRLSTIYWLDQEHTWGVDATGIWLPDASERRLIAGFGDPASLAVLARPFFNVNANAQDADPISVPGVQAGALVVSMPRRLWSADANLRYSECTDLGPITRLTFLWGGRIMGLDEKLLFGEALIDLPDVNGVGGNFTTLRGDFITRNLFYGGQLGWETETRVGPMVVTLTGKVAGGVTWQDIQIGGATLVMLPDGTQVFDPRRALLVQPTNIGRFSRHRFGLVPEVGVNIAWDFNEHFRVSVGYDLVYWTRVVRPGDQIDTQVNVGAIGDPGQFGSSPHPLVPFNTTGFWVQGLTAGLVVSY